VSLLGQSIESGEITDGTIKDADIAADAGIADTKLGTISTPGKVANSATTATAHNTPNAIVARDGSGNFAAGTITATFQGNGAGLTNIPWSALPAVPLTNGQADVLVQGLTSLGNLSVTATAWVNRLVVSNGLVGDGSGLINLNASALASGTVPEGRLPAQVSLLGQSIESGEITDGTIKDADIAADAGIADTKLGTISTPGKVANSATTATSDNVPDTIVLRDGMGGFIAGPITAERFIGDGSQLRMLDASALALGIVPNERLSARVSLLGQSIESGEITDGTIKDADIAADAGIADTKLGTISTPGKVANSATTATSANTPNAIVARDSLGNFVAGTITASFQGNGAGLTNLNASALSSGTVPDARLGTNIARLNQPATFTGTVTAPTLQAATVIADHPNTNNGSYTPGLILGGSSSGEAIASKRTAGGNQYGLDFFTAFTSRMAIANNGAIRFGPGNYFSTYGDAQSCVYVLRGTSSGTSYGELFMPGNQRLVVPANSTWTFRIFVAGRASNGKAAGYYFRGFLENESGTVRMLEAVNTEDYAEDDTAWDASIAADDYYDALVITARGNTGDSVRWTAVVYTCEVKW
jgi:hypothetical protein